ncbi:MAG: DNA-binding protein [Proteobacteria bacterium]|nr:DNA-binding protein [Pseudomonadota bacterium]|tara:strand:+ start:329 stop:736 length:408 start_codon:yes stop_codon:yes gene_type:complete
MSRPTAYDRKLAEIERIRVKADQKIEELKVQANDLRSQEIKPVLLSILDSMAQYGITVEDILEAVQVANSFRKKGKNIKVKGRSSDSNRTRKLEPKYINHKTGETWSGRGKLPNWLRKEESEGIKREFFLVKKKK